MLTKAPKGTKDIFGNEMEKWHEAEEKLRSLCNSFGISEIRTPMFEHTELFLRGVGDTTDIVQKEMYTFMDKGNRSITLRPELTAGIVRAYVEHGMHNAPQPTKLYYIAPSFRYENTQAGRQRQFHQFGAEFFGSYDPALDAEAISLAAEALRQMGVKNIALKINSLGCPDCRKVYNKRLEEYLGNNLDNLCPDCRERFGKNPLRILDCKNDRCKKIVENAPSVLKSLDDDCREHFEKLQEILDGMGIAYTIDDKIVRGLDYYTRTVFEFVTDTIGAQGTVCGGGRYDNLVEECGGQKTGACGFAMGMERLLLTLKAQDGDSEIKPFRHIYIGSIGEAGFLKAQSIAFNLRQAGILAESDTVGRSVKAQMKYADKIGAIYSIIIGDDEIQNDKIDLKNMRTKEILTIRLSELPSKMLALISKI